uniref:F-box protein CPR30-like n=1 Tax=Nicotiana tabacum TaxID=4097 RepID=A0A1S3ZUU2_TOBAC
MVFSKRIAATSIAGLSYDSESLPLLPEELISEIYTPKASCENLAEDAKSCRYKKYFIWNPSTREFKELPLSQRDITGSYRETYGFGYNECQKDYKIVVIKRKKDTEYGLSFIVVWEVICVFYVDDHRMDVWVMKEHGLGESWNLVISVPLCNFGRPWPIFIFQNDEVLLKDGS